MSHSVIWAWFYTRIYMYLSCRRTAKVLASLCVRAVSPGPHLPASLAKSKNETWLGSKFFNCSSAFSHFLSFYTPPHKKWRCIMLYPPNFECPSVRLSVNASFPCSNFSTFWPIFFKLWIDIGIGEQWYWIASGLISFWNNRVMALDVCQKCFALRFRALTLVPFYRFSSNFA